MKKPKKILLISTIVIFVLWFGSNLGLYIFMKYFVVGEERLKLINKMPENIEITNKDFAGQKIHFGDIEFKLPYINYESAILSPSIDILNQEVNKYTIFLILIYEYEDRNSSMTIHLWNPDQKFADSYIELSNFTLNDFSIWNIISNYHLFADMAGKFLLLSNNTDLEQFPLSIVRTKYVKGFWTINSGKKASSTSFELSKNGKSYSFYLFGSDVEGISDNMKNIISSIKPIEDSENILQELSSKYKEQESIFEKQLALISLISIEGPTIDNLSELKKLLIQKGARVENIDELQKQIDILSSNANAIAN